MSKVISLKKIDLTEEAKKIDKILTTSTELASVLLSISFIDELLERLLRSKFIKKSNTVNRLLEKGILGSIKAKIDIAYCLELISKIQLQDLDTLIDIRNLFAHHYKDISFNNPEITNLCDKLHLPKSYLNSIEEQKQRENLEKITGEYGRAKFYISAIMIINSIILALESNS